MALQTAALLVLAQNYAGDIEKQINRKAVALSILDKSEDEGKNVAWAAKGDGAVAEFYVEGSDVTNFATDSQTPAVLPWAQARSNFSVSGFARAAARSSRTPVSNIDLLAQDMLSGVEKLADMLNKALYTGQSGQTPEQIVGLDEAIGLDANTYAGIDRSQVANAYWKPYVIANSGTPQTLTLAQIRKDMREIYKKSGAKPNLALVGPSTFATVAGLFDPARFYVIQTQGAEAISRMAPMFEGGCGTIMFDGCLFVEDKDATEGKIYYLNTSTVSVRYLPHGEPGPGEDDEVMDLILSDGFDQIPLGLRMEALAKTGDAEKIMMKLYPQLRVKRPNMCGVRKDIAVAS